MGKGHLSFRRLSSIRHRKKGSAVKDEAQTSMVLSPPAPTPINSGGPIVGVTGKAKKKTGGARLWMRFDRTGAMEVVECDKSTIIKRASVPARDLRILGPVFSHSSNILAREKAIVVNLEVIKAIVTAEEVLILDPLRPEVLPLIERLKQQFPLRNGTENASANVQSPLDPEGAEGLQSELPFEFQVLEIALEVVCSIVDTSVAALETEAWPILDELTKHVSTENLEYVRSLKSNLTRLLARVQKVRDELEHLLDDNEDMADLYLTRKWIQNQQTEAILAGTASNSIVALPHNTSNLHRLASNRSASMLTSNADEDDVEDLEMLLEAYFMQLEGMRNKILTVREYIDDTEDYVNIQLDNQRNELIQLQLILTIASFAIAAETLLASLFGMNIPCPLYEMDGIFGYFVWSITAFCLLLFLVILGYASQLHGVKRSRVTVSLVSKLEKALLEEAAFAYLLSKRWRNLYTIIQKVEFDDRIENQGSLMDFLDGVVALPPGSGIRKFSLTCQKGVDPTQYAQVNRRLCNVLKKRGVLELKLDINAKNGYSLPFGVFTCKTVAKLDLGTDSALDLVSENAFLPVLRTLVLNSHESINALRNFFSAFPLLL
ncbi:unnamed protein product [Arabis nemorensis]|uniref:Magnesium transporter n=1 Tax=Arabis nemorensis TaxID=586526 RepID=A0A565BXU1_9BRAS|nr:unnamed protein product [Arabis nemorensis]